MADGSKKYKNLVHGITVICQEEGLRKGIFKGIEASCAREASYSSLRLGLYEPIKRAIGTGTGKDTQTWKKFAAGGLSGAIGSAIANPADLLKTRMQASPAGEHMPLKWHINDIYRAKGFFGFYVGVGPTVIRATLLNGTKLGTYDSIKHKIIDDGYMKDGKPCQFVASVFAGFFMTCVTSPMDNIKTRVMNQYGDKKKYNGIIDCAQKMVRHEGGFIAFYRGFGSQWARFAPFSIIQLLTWEFLRTLCGMEGL